MKLSMIRWIIHWIFGLPGDIGQLPANMNFLVFQAMRRRARPRLNAIDKL